MKRKVALSTILNLLAKKYPTDYKNGINPALLIYGDESGKIIKNALHFAYEYENRLFQFDTIDELVLHLQGE